MTNNPGVGLKLTAPRISSTSESTGPGPQSYDVPRSLHTTDREKAQNEVNDILMQPQHTLQAPRLRHLCLW